MQHGARYHRNGTRNIIFLYTEQKACNSRQRRHPKQQNTEMPVPTRIKEITGADEEHYPLFFQPENIPIQKKNEEKKERKPKCRKQHLSRV